ncbi:hypothetical protein ACFLU5_00025 [Bacteroidota bacterium]
MDEITPNEIEAVKALTDKELTGMFHLLHDHEIEYVENHAKSSQLYLDSPAFKFLIDWALGGSATVRLNQLSDHVHSEYWRRQFN